MKKKVLSLIIILALCLTMALSFVACNKGDQIPKDTFYKGTLSEESYDTANEAAEAFLANEVAGDVTDAQMISYTKKSKLSESEINELNISAKDKSQITSAEKGVIKYSVSDAGQTATAAASSSVAVAKQKNVTVYIIVIKGDFKYYAPPLSEGDVVTRSYFEEVFDPSKYTNCTVSVTNETTTNVKSGGFSQKGTVKTSIDMQIADKQVYATYAISGSGMKVNMEMFFVFEDKGLTKISKVYIKTDKKWTSISASEFVQMNLDLDMSPSSDNDNSFFIKTETGFKVNSEKFNEYISTVFDAISATIGFDINIKTADANAEYFVNEGRVYKINTSFSADLSATMGIKGSVSTTSETNYSNFGTTKVSVPKDLKLEA